MFCCDSSISRNSCIGGVEMSVFKKKSGDVAKEAGILFGNEMSRNMQKATNAAIDGMDLFKWKVETPIIQNGHFDTQKGNLFEYIEAAKFNVDASKKGMTARAVVTDTYDPGAAADILIKDNNSIVKEVQAKFSDSKHPAADSVSMQRKDKYYGMQRLIRKDDNYIDPATGKETTLLKKAKAISKDRAETEGNLYQKQYKDVHDNLTDELHYDKAKSGGTTLEEIKDAYENPKKYAQQFERKQVALEMKYTATSMAKASFVSTGIVSGINNMMAVWKEEKDISAAAKDITQDAVKGAAKGAATGVVSTAIRYEGAKNGVKLLSDSTAATVMAGGLIDGGVALLSYAKGEIDEEKLVEELVDTTAKATTTIFFTKAVTSIMGKAVNPILPFAVYTTASFVYTATKEIIKEANLQAEEYDRMTALLVESGRQIDEYNKQLQQRLANIEANQKRIMDEFLYSFNYNLSTGENYDEALLAIVRFAEQTGLSLQHVKFDDFSNAMKSKQTFILE